MHDAPFSRRAVIAASLGGFVALAWNRAWARTTVPKAAPTPACGDGDDGPTPSQTEGPYFTPGSPERGDLWDYGDMGDPMALSGQVVDTECRTVVRALVDLWQADAAGVYDNEGYRYRGHVFTDSFGRFRFSTVKPGLYPGRTRHFHVKVQAPGGPVLTTQLYFPDEPANATDGLYQPELEMTFPTPPEGRFTFVVET